MNVTEAIRNRRSIRKFQQGVQIPQEDLDLILEAAMMAPSARNTRPWEFVVVILVCYEMANPAKAETFC